MRTTQMVMLLSVSLAHSAAAQAPLWVWDVQAEDSTYRRAGIALVDDSSCGPQVVVEMCATGVPWSPAKLSMRNGATGNAIWTHTAAQVVCGLLAVADINGDGAAEILAVSNAPTGELLAFNRDGSLLWSSSTSLTWSAGVRPNIHVGDLNGDDVPEIVAGGAVFDNTGVLRFTFGLNSTGVQIDDYDPNPAFPGKEILVGTDGGATTLIRDGGATAWSYVWPAPLTTAYAASADFDYDGWPEVVTKTAWGASAIQIRMLAGDTGQPIGAPMVVEDGPMAIGDIDGDGQLDVVMSAFGQAMAVEWSVAASTWRVKWSLTIDLGCCNSPALFDFDGDGAAEVVVQDDFTAFVIDGATGTVLFSWAIRSATGWEPIVIADINNDGTTDIMTSAQWLTGSIPNSNRVIVTAVLGSQTSSQTWGQSGYVDPNLGGYRWQGVATPGACCGNGTLDAGEQCDDGNVDRSDACDGCRLTVCGDGVPQAPNGQGQLEQCDDGNSTNGDGCRADCTAELCGDATLDPNEQCDDGNTVPCDGCNITCMTEVCGNATLDCNESCDDGNTLPGDGCRADCTIEMCGDGIIDAGEECDDGNTIPGDGCSDCTIDQCSLAGIRPIHPLFAIKSVGGRDVVMTFAPDLSADAYNVWWVAQKQQIPLARQGGPGINPTGCGPTQSTTCWHFDAVPPDIFGATLFYQVRGTCGGIEAVE